MPSDENEEEYDVVADDESERGAMNRLLGRQKKAKRKTRKVRSDLSRKATDMQVRLRVVQARQLMGNSLYPVVRVSVSGHMKQTRILKETSSPWWDETFFFNFKISPVELVEDVVEFAVFNSQSILADALIGAFKCDIGMIYDEDQHALINKWVMLTDPDDSAAGVKGYLKISACVLGPGDSCPDMQPSRDDEEENIEKNLLRPAGVELRPATFALRVFCAEDIPRMDSAFFQGKDDAKSVDPYFVFSFAGKEVQSKVMYGDNNPDFHQELRIGLHFPSMCERFRFQIRDWDSLNADDHVATVIRSISEISSHGEFGYLPTLGPTFVNFYGSPREFFHQDEYEDLNLGKGEGVAYRGRVLVQLITRLGELPDKPVENIVGEAKHRVEKYKRRKKYRVCAAFLDASMISAAHADASIELEISIGNFGNILDKSAPPSCSTTSPLNALYDGNHYYYLPWGGTKPCVVLDCSWENISWRLESLNTILATLDRLEDSVERVRTAHRAELPHPELKQMVVLLLDRLIVDCGLPLSTPDPAQNHLVNTLDKRIQEEREDALLHIKTHASALKKNVNDLDDALKEIEEFVATLKTCAVEPQNSVPDVIISMIIGRKRHAYYRIPANDLLFSTKENCRGRYCGKVITIPLKYPSVDNTVKMQDIPLLLRLRLFLGTPSDDHEWRKMQTGGKLGVFAETYENEVRMLGKWPTFSDREGKIELKKEDFKPPPGWKWDGEWFINPNLAVSDTTNNTALEETYECQSRDKPGSNWMKASIPWTDVKGDKAADKAAVTLPRDWTWNEDWKVDKGKSVDANGWEYCVDLTKGGFSPTEEAYHLFRRRRWIRHRTYVQADGKQKQEVKQIKYDYNKKYMKDGGWENASWPLIRRRRWHRKLVSTKDDARGFFNAAHVNDRLDKKLKLASEGCSPMSCVGDEAESVNHLIALASPRMFLTYKKPHKYQLRAYIYQARNVLAADDSGLSDAFARVAFMNKSMVTEKVDKSLSPTWDQTLVSGEVTIFDDPDALALTPPDVYVELFDYDTYGKPEFLGRTKAQPMVKLNPGDNRTPVLQWYKILRHHQDGGELLAAFELIKMTGDKMPPIPPKRGNVLTIPNDIRPVLQRTGIEVLCWGLRNMQNFQLAAVTSPSIRFECAGHVKDSPTIKNMKTNLNFTDNTIFFDIVLPTEKLYMPAMNIRVKDHRRFGRKPTVGVYTVPSLDDYRCDPEEELAALEPPSPMDRTNPKPGFKGKVNWLLGRNESANKLTHIEEGTGPEIKLELCRASRNAIEEYPASLITSSKIPSLGMNPRTVFTMVEEKRSSRRNMKPRKNRSKRGKHGLSTQREAFSYHLANKNNSGSFFSKIADRKRYKALHEERRRKKMKHVENDKFSKEIDWWYKYYCSSTTQKEREQCKRYISLGYDSLEILPNELEKDPRYNGFQDFCETFDLSMGKKDDDDTDRRVGEFKGSFRVYELPSDPSLPLPPRVFKDLPPSTPETCIVRIYIIRAFDLQPADTNGKADPYVELKLGTQKMSTVDEYQPNTTNPVFGKQFEMTTVIPFEKDLIVRVWDYDLLTADDIIGETTIDLENRVLSRHRGTCGLPKTYSKSGINKWRDARKPTDILIDFCRRNMHTTPVFDGKTVCKVGARTYRLSDFERGLNVNAHWGEAEQRLALHILNLFPLVKEHVESRPIYNPLQPSIEQGRLLMWVDIFPSSLGPPPSAPCDITARKPSQYVLRVIIWNCYDVILDEEAITTGEKMSDIYVQGWLNGIEEDKQSTDVHYRSLNGEGNFNWRFVFPFEYQAAEQCMVIKKKDHFWSLDQTEQKIPPKFICEVWDNDSFSPDDFLGHVELNLHSMPKPAKTAYWCSLKTLPGKGRSVKLVSLFDMKRVRGFWPVFDESTGTRLLTGKVEMELELLSHDEAEELPAGKGREEPNAHPKLEEPKRPDTSFIWFLSPFRTFRYIIWNNYKWKLCWILLVLAILVILALFLYTLPGAINAYAFQKLAEKKS